MLFVSSFRVNGEMRLWPIVCITEKTLSDRSNLCTVVHLDRFMMC